MMVADDRTRWLRTVAAMGAAACLAGLCLVVWNIGHHGAGSAAAADRLSLMLGRFVAASWLLLLLLRHPTTVLAFVDRHHGLATGFAVAAYALFVAGPYLTPAALRDPVIVDDYSIHFANAIQGAAHIINRFSTVGYTPFHGAGAISYGIDEFWSTLFVLALGWLTGPVPAFNISVLASYLLPPLLVWRSAFNVGLDRASAFFLVALCLLACAGHHRIWAYYQVGMYGFNLATFLSIHALSLTDRYVREKRLRHLALATLAGSFAIWVHPTSAFMFTVLFVPFALLRWRLFRARDILLMAAALTLVIVSNLPWLLPVLDAWRANPPPSDLDLGQTGVSLLFDTIRGDRPFVALLLLFAYSCGLALRARQPHFGAVMALAFLPLFCASFFGTQLGLGFSEPARYVVPLVIVMIYAAAAHMRSQIERRSVVWAFLLALVVITLVPYRPQPVFGHTGDPRIAAILGVLEARNEPSARLLIQEAPYAHAYAESHIAATIPWYTGMEVTATPYPGLLPFHTQFIDSSLFQKPLGEWSSDELAPMLNLYSIGYILVHRPWAAAFFRSLEGMTELCALDSVVLFRYNGMEASRCLDCEADVAATFDRLVVKNARSPVTTLKYHYYPGMRVEPRDLEIEPIRGHPTFEWVTTTDCG